MGKEFFHLDLTGKDRELKTTYHGANTNFHVETRIMKEEGKNIIVGVSLPEDDTPRSSYDDERKSLDIWYKRFLAEQVDGIFMARAGGLYMQSFTTPADIKEVNIFDFEQPETSTEIDTDTVTKRLRMMREK